MSRMMPEMGSIFQYGFLASNVSRLIALYNNVPGYRLSEENKEIVRNANNYIDDILYSQNLILGKTTHVPSSFGLKAFRNALNTLKDIKSEAANDPTKRNLLFENIKSALTNMIDETKTDINRDQLNIAKIFFGAVADLYLKEANNKFKFESTSRPNIT